MKLTPWILGSLAAVALAACGPGAGNRAGDTGMGGGTATPADTALTGADTVGTGAAIGDTTSR